MVGETKNFSAWMRAGDIQSSIMRCNDLFNTGIFNSNNSTGVIFEAAVTLVVLNLHDLLQKAHKDGKRVDFVDDVEITKNISDVTDLISACRNAACHISSGSHNIESCKFTFCVATGYGPGSYSINGKDMGCDYADDIAIYYGEKRVYVRRHLHRSLGIVASLYSEDGSW
ncbi:hypothetical protein [Pseudomonas syringae]|uniref:hypothetical protein n=1 Tax=Pseudomonas syringae TaxID=317 RepID=UPI000F004481|nr:hypothetical protein [Pseudomonas syringae]